MPLGSAPSPSDWPGEHDELQSAGDVAGAVSTRIVGLLREHAGRGPTKAKTIVSSDLVVITLGGCLTTAERQLDMAGHGDLVSHTRGAIHKGMRIEASAIVEELTGRAVAAYLTDQHLDPDVAVIVFFLAPVD